MKILKRLLILLIIIFLGIFMFLPSVLYIPIYWVFTGNSPDLFIEKLYTLFDVILEKLNPND